MIVPKLIHPIRLSLAKLILAEGMYDDKWKTRKKTVEIKWDTEESKLVQFLAQLRNRSFNMYDAQKGGWIRTTKLSFYVKSEDAIDDGKYKFDKGDKIVRMQDLDGLVSVDVELYVKEVTYRAPYQRFEFVQIMCENEVPRVPTT